MQHNFPGLADKARPPLPNRYRLCAAKACSHATPLSPARPSEKSVVTFPRIEISPVLRGCTLAVVVALCRPHIVQAAGRNSWEPRRHFRRFPRNAADQDAAEEAPVSMPAVSRDSEPQQPGSLRSQFVALKDSVQRTVQPLVESASGGVRSNDHDRLQTASRVASATQDNWMGSVSVPARPEVYRTPVSRLSPISGPVAGAIAVAAGGLMLAWLLLRQVWQALRGYGRGGQSGKWVADRGLGGKEIFVPDDAPGAKRGSRQQRQRDLRLPEEVRPMTTSSGTRVLSGRRAPLHAEPEWWLEPRPPMYVHPNQKEQAEKSAKQLLRGLQNAKIGGQAYLMSAIVELRETCQSAGISVKPATDAGRDSIFRAAVTAAISEALHSQAGRLANLKPQHFVAGVSKDLGVPLGRAVQIVHAEVASRVRNMIIDACAAKRAGNIPEEMQQMLRLSALLAQFPLPRESAEGEIIASSISAKSTLEERQSIFLAFGAMAPLNAPLMAELLGFDPVQVLPRLEEYTRNN